MVIDRNARRSRDDPDWSGVQLLHPDDVDRSGQNAGSGSPSASSPRPMCRSNNRCLQLGFEDVVPFYDLAESFRHLHPLSNGWFAAPLTADDQANTAKVLARWDDDISRAHHLQFLAWRRLREEWTFDARQCPTASRFFIPEVASVLHGNEIFLDAGAHHGGVTETFVQQTKGAFRQIIASRAGPIQPGALAGELQSWLPDDPRVSVYDCALAEDDGDSTVP